MGKDILEHLNQERVAELAPPAGLRVAPGAPVRDVIAEMQRNRTGCALVCEGSRLVGIFTEQDYVRRVLGAHLAPTTPISNCMSLKPATIRDTDSVAALVNRMYQGRYRRLPVVNARDELVGCVSVRNLVHHLAEHFPAAVYNLAPVSKPMQRDREGA